MKKLTKKQTERLDKKRIKTKQTISKYWDKYRKNPSEANYLATLDLISKEWEKYRGIKYTITHKTKFNLLIPEQHIKTPGTVQDFFKVRKGANLNKVFEQIIEQSKKTIKYILVIFKIRTEEGMILLVSESFTPEKWELAKTNGIDIYEQVLKKLSFVQKYAGYNLISQHIRIIYESFKAPEKTKKVRN